MSEPDDDRVRLDRLERAFFGWQDVNGTYIAGLQQTLYDLKRSVSDMRAETQARQTMDSLASAAARARLIKSVRWLIGIAAVNFLAITHIFEVAWSWVAAHWGVHP